MSKPNPGLIREEVFMAFPDSPPPDPSLIASTDHLHPGELSDVLGFHWRVVAEQGCHVADTAYLSAVGFQYYLPAVLLVSIDEKDANGRWHFPRVFRIHEPDLLEGHMLTLPQVEVTIAAARLMRRDFLCDRDTLEIYKRLILALSAHAKMIREQGWPSR